MSPLFVARWIPLFLPFVPAALASPPYVIHIRMSPAIHVTSGRSITLRVFAVIQQQQQYLSQLREYVYSQIRWCYARCGWKPVYEPRHQAVITYASAVTAFTHLYTRGWPLTSDLWPWKPFQQCQLTCWIFVAGGRVHPLGGGGNSSTFRLPFLFLFPFPSLSSCPSSLLPFPRNPPLPRFFFLPPIPFPLFSCPLIAAMGLGSP